MQFFKARALINAPTERVWRVLVDVLRWPQWLPTVTSVEALGSPTLTVGASYRLIQPKLRPVVWSVIELMLQSRFDWESRSPGLRILASHVLIAVSSGSTSSLHQVTFSGPFAGLTGLIAGRRTCDYIQSEAASLKRRVETMPL